jgi:hypothetical protein
LKAFYLIPSFIGLVLCTDVFGINMSDVRLQSFLNLEEITGGQSLREMSSAIGIPAHSCGRWVGACQHGPNGCD